MTGRLVYVMGPSGAGKDTLLAFARERLDGANGAILAIPTGPKAPENPANHASHASEGNRGKAGDVFFARRYITRPANAGGEDHIALSCAEFASRGAAGRFALEWSSHGLRYGIDVEIDAWLASGYRVVVNGSRAHFAATHARYPSLRAILVDAAPQVLAARLATRGREASGEILARLARQPVFDVPAGTAFVRIDNSGLLSDAGTALIRAICD
jgi:ribose 1,5-bisphosphokinase